MHGSDARSVAEAVAAEAAAEAVAVVAAAARRPYYTLASSTSGRLLGRAVRQSRYVFVKCSQLPAQRVGLWLRPTVVWRAGDYGEIRRKD